MMKNPLSIGFILCLLASSLSSQNQNNNWYFGFHAGLNFNTTPPTPLESTLFTHEGTASLSDPAGNLLFYTNGTTIWDRTHSAMPNGSGLHGGESSTQAALILPLPNSCGIYYVFNTEDHLNNGGLYYSVVDMCLNNGMGDVVAASKNTLLLDSTTEKLTAVLHANGTDIWVITHKLGSQEFAAFMLTATGINPVPVISAVGFSYPANGHIGPAKANHRGDKIVSAATFLSNIELLDFDNTTGQLSNAKNLNSLFSGPLFFYGVEFSPNDSLLYVTSSFVESVLYQLDLATDEVTVLNQQTGNYIYGALQLGPDGKIYMARSDSAFLDVIHQPDRKGIASQYEEKGMQLFPGTYSRLGLPNFAPYSHYRDTIESSLGMDTTICAGESIVLQITPPDNCEASYLWSNGSTLPSITISEPGTYWVQVESECFSVADSIVVSTEACCDKGTSAILGEAGVRERGFSVSPTREQDGFYIAGLRNDSLLLMKMSLNGEEVWSRVIDVTPGNADYAVSIITDSEGMVGISGIAGSNPAIGGNSWVLRYNPYTQSVLWIREVFTQLSRDITHGLNQNGPGGDYMVISNPVDDNVLNDDALVTFFNKDSGDPVLPSKNFNVDELGNSENLYELIREGEFIYGVGRFTDGDHVSKMRHALIKLNASDFSVVWAKLGHQPENVDARLYGTDMIISGGFIYSVYAGDPSGTSVTNTKLYLQKTTLDGEVVWLRNYELPKNNDYAWELIESNGGIVVFDFKRSSPGAFYLFKIDFDGEVQWAKSYGFEHEVNMLMHGIGSSQLIEVGGHLVFTGYRDDGFGEEDIVVIRTDLEGNLDVPCVSTSDIEVSATEITSPTFYNVIPEESDKQPEIVSHTGTQIVASIPAVAECVQSSDTTVVSIEATICQGENFEGYTDTGIYQDTFIAQNGCDSIRILHLFVTPLTITTIQKEICSGQSFEGYTAAGVYQDTFSIVNGCDSLRVLHLFILDCEPIVEYDLNACRSYMVDGSHMDYSEFTPAYPTTPACADVSASVVFRSADPMNKHSCTPGIANSEAMCISTYNSCTYNAGNVGSLIIEINVDPQVDSAFRLTGLEFYEKSPVMYTWIDGPSGPNDYPRLYGIRILKNGTEIYRQTDIETTTAWTLQSFDFTDDLFRTEEPALFRIELLPYCPVGNGAEVSAWDVDEFRIFGACGTVLETQPVVNGFVSTRLDAAIPGVTMMLDKDHGFSDPLTCQTSFYGQYTFNAPDAYEDYYVKGYKNDDLLNGVSTLDMLAIQKHLLGKTPFTTLHQYVAADINNSGSVSAMDILDLRKALLGIKNEFPRNTSWRFGTLPQDFSGSDLFAFRETGHVDFKGTDSIQTDFVGIKIGDLNNSATLHAGDLQIGSRSGSTILMKIPDVEFESGEYITIPVTLNNALHVEGLQLVIDVGGLVLQNIESGVLDISSEYVHYVDGNIRISWSHPLGIDISANDILFTMTFLAAKSGKLSDHMMTLTENILRPEIYSSLEEVHALDIQWYKKSPGAYDDFAFTALPNPFHSELTVRFFLPSPEKVRITFFDVSGKVIYEVAKEYEAGIQFETMRLDHVGSGGIIFCQMISQSQTKVIKLVQSR
jgi:hypothetical protein